MGNNKTTGSPSTNSSGQSSPSRLSTSSGPSASPRSSTSSGPSTSSRPSASPRSSTSSGPSTSPRSSTSSGPSAPPRSSTSSGPSTSPTESKASPTGTSTKAAPPPFKTEFKYKEDSKGALEALGLGSTATQAEIKKAYHKQAREHHPDKGGEELKFKQISNAYAYLSDSSPKPDAPIQSDTRQQGSSNTNSPPPRGPTTQSDARQAPPRTNTSRQQGSSDTHSSPPSRSYSATHSSGGGTTQTSNQASMHQQSPIHLAPMMQTQNAPNSNASPYIQVVYVVHVVPGGQKTEDAINRILNTSQFDSPPQCIKQPGKMTEKVAFNNSKDSITFATAAAKENISFKLQDHNSNILAYSNGDGKLYTGKHVEYQPGQTLDPVSSHDFSKPRSSQIRK